MKIQLPQPLTSKRTARSISGGVGKSAKIKIQQQSDEISQSEVDVLGLGAVRAGQGGGDPSEGDEGEETARGQPARPPAHPWTDNGGPWPPAPAPLRLDRYCLSMPFRCSRACGCFAINARLFVGVKGYVRVVVVVEYENCIRIDIWLCVFVL